jgi:uncharacterized protein YukE
MAPDAGGTGEPASTGTPSATAPGPASDGQPAASGNAPSSQFAQYMGLDLSSIPEHERPVMVERLKQIDAKFTPAMQEVAELRKVSEQYGMTPTQMANVVQALQANPEVLTQLFNPKPAAPANAGPDLSNNVYLQDPDARAAIEHIAREMSKQSGEKQAAMEQRMNALLSNMAQETCGKAAASFLDTHKEYGLTPEKLRDAAMELGPALRLRPDDPKLMAMAAVHALGGVDTIAEKAGAAKVQAYIDQTKSNGKVGTTVQGGPPPVTAPVPPKSVNDKGFKQSIMAALEAREASRK